MTAATFLRAVLGLWGDHWQRPLLALLAEHGHRYTRQTLWNWKSGNRRVPEHVAVILGGARKTRQPSSMAGTETALRIR